MSSADGFFASTLRLEYDRVCEAAASYGDVKGMLAAVFFQETWDTCFEPLTHASADDAEANAVAWDRTVIYHLESEATAQFGSLQSIWTLTEGWEGPASREFRTYCGDLEGALRQQWAFALAMKGLMQLQAELIRAMQEGALDICRQTASALGAAAAEHQAQQRQRLADLGQALVDTLAGAAGGAGGGPAGVVAGAVSGAISGFGSALVNQLVAIDGEEPEDIRQAMVRAVSDLRFAVRSDQQKLIDGLEALQQECARSHLRGRLVPPEVRSLAA